MRSVPVLVLVASTLASSACKSSPSQTAASYLSRGDDYARQQRPGDAIIEYRNAVKAAPQSADAHKRLAQALLLDEAIADALREFSRAADLAPDDTEAQLNAAALLQATGQFEDAKARARAMLVRNPRSVDAQIILSEAEIGLKDPTTAVEQIEGALKLYPTEGRIYGALAVMQMKGGRTDEAEANFKKAIELEPKSSKGYVGYGYFLWATRRIPEAEATFKQGLELSPRDAFINRVLALLYLTTGRAPQAESYLRTLADETTDGAIGLADYYVTIHRLSDAKLALQPLLSKGGTTANRAKLTLVTVELAEGRKDSARQTLDEVLTAEPNNALALVAKTRLQMDEGKTADALTTVDLAIRVDEKNAAAHYLKGLLLVAKGTPRDAIEPLKRAEALSPGAIIVPLKIAEVSVSLAAFDEVVRAADQATTIDPRNPAAHLLLARGLLGRGDLISAEKELKLLLTANPRFDGAHAVLGHVYARKHEVSTARREYARALELAPNNIEALTGLAALEIDAKQPAEAQKLVRARLQTSPNDPALLLLSARAAFAAADLDAAEGALKQVVTIDASNVAAYSLLGELYARQNRLQDARTEYEGLAERQPTSIVAHTMIAMILEAQGNVDQAEERYRRVLQIDPHAAVAANNLAWLMVQKGENLDEALSLAQRAQGALATDPEVCDTLGWIYYQKNMPEPALKFLSTPVAQGSTNPVHYYHLGMAYNKAGEFVKAKATLAQAFKLGDTFPGADEARQTLATLNQLF